jgi:hypothetical protein
MWSLVFSKTIKVYIWRLIDRKTREIIGCYLGSAEKVFPGGRSQESGVRSQEFQALLPLFFVPSDVLQEG